MKRIAFFLSPLVLLALGGCHFAGFNKTTGSNTMKLEKRSVPAFTAVNISGAYQVEIVAQKEQSLEIEADDNLLPLIRTEVNNGVLEITNEKSYDTKQFPRVLISVPQLAGISTSGASEMVVSNVKSDEFRIDTSGASSIKVVGETKQLALEMSGAGNVDAQELRAERVTVNSSGAASADVYASEDLRIDASGAGHVNYYGNPKHVSEDVSGAASISKQ